MLLDLLSHVYIQIFIFLEVFVFEVWFLVQTLLNLELELYEPESMVQSMVQQNG